MEWTVTGCTLPAGFAGSFATGVCSGATERCDMGVLGAKTITAMKAIADLMSLAACSFDSVKMMSTAQMTCAILAAGMGGKPPTLTPEQCAKPAAVECLRKCTMCTTGSSTDADGGLCATTCMPCMEYGSCISGATGGNGGATGGNGGATGGNGGATGGNGGATQPDCKTAEATACVTRCGVCASEAVMKDAANHNDASGAPCTGCMSCGPYVPCMKGVTVTNAPVTAAGSVTNAPVAAAKDGTTDKKDGKKAPEPSAVGSFALIGLTVLAFLKF